MRPPGRAHVPVIAERLLALVLPSALREEVLSDLADLATRPDRKSPNLWYWRQVFATLWPPTLLAMYVETTRADAAWPERLERGATFVEGLLSDARRAARSLRRRRAYALTAIATLAIGIGATTAMFSVAWGVALRPLPYEHAGRLFTVCTRAVVIPAAACVLSPPNAADLKQRVPEIEFLGVGRRWEVKVGSGEDAESVPGAVVTPDVFRAFGVRAQRGRLLEETDLIGRPSTVAMISDAYWRARFGAGDVIGRGITLDGQRVTIVGVLPPGVEVPRLEAVDIWRPLHVDPLDEENRQWAGFHVFGRVRAGHTSASVAARVAAVVPQLRDEHFRAVDGWDLIPRSLTDWVLGSSRDVLVLFLAAVGLLLLVACANVANLMLAQSRARVQEWGVRTALGASPERLVSLQLTESFLLAFSGAAVGLAVAIAGVRAFRRFAPAGLPRVEEVAVSPTVLTFTIAVAAVTAVIFGVAPALHAAHVNVAGMLRSGGRTTTRGRGRLSATLVAAEIAIALTLIVAAGLVTRSFAGFARWNPGFDAGRVGTFWMSASSDRYDTRDRIAQLWATLEREIGSIPGVEAVATASAGPMFGGGDGSADFRIPGRERPAPAAWYNVGPGFFHALGVPTLRGREVEERDGPGAPLAAVVNETFARRYFGPADPVGATISSVNERERRTLIVGVVRDVPPFTPGAPVEPQIYWSNRQEPRWGAYFVLRTTVRPALLAEGVRLRIRGVDPELRPGAFETIADLAQYELRRPLFNMLLLTAFALTALLLAGVGTYALLAYLVSQRDREIGIRLALGAQPRQVATLVMRDAALLAGPGIGFGLLGAYGAGRSVSALIHGVSPTDPATFAAGVGAIAFVAAIACLAPAWRAMRVPPAVTLTGE